MKRLNRLLQLVVVVPTCLSGCCGALSIDLADYTYLREDPEECVRYFQLAVELGMWEEAADCLVSDTEDVGPWGLWFISDRPEKELGDLSLNDILIGTFFIGLAADIPSGSRRAVVAVESHPTEEIIQRYDLLLVKREDRWFIHLDKTFNLNAVSQ